ncbi:hypothetical protein Clacol_010014 [Clathrus columnatus]|uniref:GDP-Man:Man(3)GlcNAc(2)-PP-Dol alpha-1,2-mannosyltransferase n=1 Tax=Clathrus columnatus TaxID=1419009 RepID=A0AAV5AM72_9AGAM|nr:hypothetical protein Clacol_010014 [Clathrus columnatus]
MLKRTIGVGMFFELAVHSKYGNAGGGGERVLWTAVAYMQREYPDIISVIYSGDKGVTKKDIIEKVASRFSISLNPQTLHFIFLKSRYMVEDSSWPRFTLIGQSLGSIYLVLEAMGEFIPDLFVDTMGYAFTFYPVRLLCQVPVGAYVHYPTISSAMVNRIGTTGPEELRNKERAAHNQESMIKTLKRKAKKMRVKLPYYTILMHLYARSLLNASFLMVNSSWTKAHVDEVISLVKNSDTHEDKGKLDTSNSQWFDSVWWIISRIIFLAISNQVPSPQLMPSSTTLSPSNKMETKIVYPPCDTNALISFPLEEREKTIVSLAQFRPEKDHAAQIEAFSELLKTHPDFRGKNNANDGVKLILMGSSRNEEDAKRVDALKLLASKHGIAENVEFKVNVSYGELLETLGKASIGLSTMVDEHFGINIVEFMAAGLIPIVHASGGPLYDIVAPHSGGITGFHAKEPASFASAMYDILSLTTSEDLAIRSRARRRAIEVFSEEGFVKGWETAWDWDK